MIIRADGNAKIGAGHLMRCLAIAQALARMTGKMQDVSFVCAEEGAAQFVHRYGFEADVLHTDPADMESELALWERYAGGDEKILVDSYQVTDRYLQTLRKYGKVYLMDDMQEHVYPVDGVINYNVFADEEWYRKNYADRGVTCLLGGRYAPLRSQFESVSYKVRGEVQNVLITTGGGDGQNIAKAVLETLTECGKALWKEKAGCDIPIRYHVVVGKFNPHFEEWQEMAKKAQNIVVHSDVQNMAELMCGCDLAVTAGGSTVYELAAVGVPFICFSYAQNQEALTEYISQKGIACHAGAWQKDSRKVQEKLAEMFRRLCSAPTIRQEYSAREKSLTDGKGAARIAEKLLREM